MALVIHQPKIVTENNIEPMTPKEMRIYFAGKIINGLVTKYGDTGGRNNKKLSDEAFRLADIMVGAYFNT